MIEEIQSLEQREFSASYTACALTPQIELLELDYNRISGGWPIVRFNGVDIHKVSDHRTLLQAADDIARQNTRDSNDFESVHKVLKDAFNCFLITKMDKAV